MERNHVPGLAGTATPRRDGGAPADPAPGERARRSRGAHQRHGRRRHGRRRRERRTRRPCTEVRSRCDVIEWGARQVARRGWKICLISFCFIGRRCDERKASVDRRKGNLKAPAEFFAFDKSRSSPRSLSEDGTFETLLEAPETPRKPSHARRGHSRARAASSGGTCGAARTGQGGCLGMCRVARLRA